MIDTETIDSYFGSLDYMPIGAFVLREDYVVLFWNSTLEHWTGIRRDEIVSTDIGDRFPHFKTPVYAGRLESIFQGGPPTVFSSQLHKHIIPSTLPGGRPRVQHTIVTASRTLSGDNIHAVFAIQDVSDLSRRVHDYAVLSKKLKESNEDLEAFTYSVSHDLRAPLRAIVGFSKILFQKFADDIPESAHRYLDIIRDSALELSDLIDDLLRLSRVGRADLEKQTINTKEFVNISFKELAHEYEGRNVEITVADDLPECEADPTLFRQVLVNLLGNAIKYTGCQDIARIEVGCEQSGNETAFFVKDNGAGFDGKYAHKVFGVFQRLHTSDEYEGTGVGLAIVKRVIDKHGGRIWAEGETNKGATFYFTLEEKRL